MAEEWMTVEETARYLQIGKTALYDLAKGGTLPSNKIGSKVAFQQAGPGRMGPVQYSPQ